MGWLLRRRLTQNSARLSKLRVELSQLDEQVESFVSDAADEELRALVSDAPDAAQHARQARKHADVFERQRERVRAQIAELEVRQDELLDQLSRQSS